MARSAPAAHGVALGALLSLMLAAGPASADEPPKAPAASSADPRVERARDLFFKGVALLKVGDCESAVGYFKRSLEETPTSAATLNAAHCLNELKRYDEALEMSRELLTTFAADLTAQNRERIEGAVAELRKKVGSIELTVNVRGRVTINGRARGEVPRDGPIPVTAGKVIVRVMSDRFVPFEQTVEVAAGGSVVVNVTMKPTPTTTTTQPPARSYAFVSAFAGYALSGSLGSTAEGSGATPSRGFMAGLRVGYRLTFGLALELSFGYLYASSEFGRTVQDNATETEPSPFPFVTYNLNDDLRFRGPLFGLGASYRIAVNPSLAILGRMTAGVISARSSDSITGRVATTGDAVATNPDAVSILVQGKSKVLMSQPGFLMPEAGIEVSWGGFRAGVLLGVVLLTANGPAFANREIGVEPRCDMPPSVGCLPNRSITNGELAYGKFVLWVPQVMASYSF